MYIRDVFHIDSPLGSFAGADILLDRNNCQIKNKTKIDNAVQLLVIRESDGMEGHAYARVRDEYAPFSHELLNWMFLAKIDDLTLNQLNDSELPKRFHKIGEKIMIEL